MKKINKRNKGITLVALVITIVILLVLAGIAIGQLTGNGLFDKAKLAKEKSEQAQANEDKTLGDYENSINKYIDGNRNGNIGNSEVGTAIIPSGTSWRKVYVEFNNEFSTPPIVLTQPMQQNVDINDNNNPYGGYNHWEVDNVTNQGFYIRYYNNTASSEVHFYWLAISN